jgi:hypothetical protein
MVSVIPLSMVSALREPLLVFPSIQSRLVAQSAPTVPATRLGVASRPMVSVIPFLSMVGALLGLLRVQGLLLRRLPSLRRLRRLPFAAAVGAPRPDLVSKPMVSVGTFSMVFAPPGLLYARVRSMGEHD